MSRKIISESMSTVGCITPFQPLHLSQEYPVCTEAEKAKFANDIYTQLVFKQKYTKDSKVWVLYKIMNTIIFVCGR